jgi:hypothetical protein
VKAGLASMLRAVVLPNSTVGPDFLPAFKITLDDAVDRFNCITFVASKLLLAHVAKSYIENQSAIPLTADDFRTCCHVVSRKSPTAHNTSPGGAIEYAATFDRIIRPTMPVDFVWPHRGGLHQAIVMESNVMFENMVVEMKRHFLVRMQRWLHLQLCRLITQAGVTEAQMKLISTRIVDQVSWNERRAGAIALAQGQPWPEPPPNRWERLRRSIVNGQQPQYNGVLLDRLLGELPAGLVLNQVSRRTIWTLFTMQLLRNVARYSSFRCLRACFQ